MQVLTVRDLRKSFGGINAIFNLDFVVEKGQIFGIIGPNGAGKTTLFNLITGFLRPDSGSIKFKDTELIGKKPHEIVGLGICRTFQLVKPFLGMSVEETLLVPSFTPRVERGGHSSDWIKARNVEILNHIGLASKENEIVDNLNQSELRLLDIARALAAEPEILCLDEPFSGLGHYDVEALLGLLNGFMVKGIAIVIIEHRLKELMRFVNKVMVINFGEKIYEGTPYQIAHDKRVIEAYLGKKGTEIGINKSFEP
jgi:branched-chain amino acid transport system ATP-binding protein